MVLGTALSMLLSSAPACACTGGGPWLSASYPSDGDLGVPTNHVLRFFVAAWSRHPPLRVFTENGPILGSTEVLALNLDEFEAPINAVLTFLPDSPLPANTDVFVDLELYAGEIDTVRFRTGPGAHVEQTPEPPSLRIVDANAMQDGTCWYDARVFFATARHPALSSTDGLFLIERLSTEGISSEHYFLIMRPGKPESSATISFLVPERHIDRSIADECFVLHYHSAAGNSARSEPACWSPPSAELPDGCRCGVWSSRPPFAVGILVLLLTLRRRRIW